MRRVRRNGVAGLLALAAAGTVAGESAGEAFAAPGSRSAAAASAVPGASGTVSGVFAPGEEAGGAVDVRTGRYSLEVPLLATAGRGEAGFALALSYD
ncbi:hypothetical protein, partial [Streptomyces sp. NRRL F-2664]|uniref:hypothetical protein n=1 Tax=Streptomyces sp. NRRL F-2664 TaxID=1463842 RepID=UPI0005BA4778